MWETTARQLAKREWKFRVESNVHFILASLASNTTNELENACHDNRFTALKYHSSQTVKFSVNCHLSNILLILHKLCDRLGPVNFQSADQDIKVPTEVLLC